MIPTSYYSSRTDERGTTLAFGRVSGRSTPSVDTNGARVVYDIPYRSNGGERHKLDLYLPNRRAFPVVVFAHGGMWISSDKALYGNLGTFLAKHGIGAALLNYRLAPQVCHPAPAQDMARAFAWTRKHIGSYGGDIDRLYLGGYSAGAHSAALLGTDEAFLAAEGLGFEHVRGVIVLSGIYKIHWNVAVARLGFVFRNTDKRAASPFWNIKTGCPPFLVQYASKELWTLSGQAYQFHKKLLQHNCQSRLLVAPGQNHYTIIETVSLPTAKHGEAIVNFIQDE